MRRTLILMVISGFIISLEVTADTNVRSSSGGNSSSRNKNTNNNNNNWEWKFFALY